MIRNEGCEGKQASQRFLGVMLKFHYIFSTSKLYPCAFFPLQDFSPFTLEFSRRVFSTTRFLTIYTRVFSVRFFHYKISRHLHQSFLCAFFPLQDFSPFTLEFSLRVFSTTTFFIIYTRVCLARCFHYTFVEKKDLSKIRFHAFFTVLLDCAFSTNSFRVFSPTQFQPCLFH